MGRFTDLLPRYERALHRLRALGVKIAPDSRLERYRHEIAANVFAEEVGVLGISPLGRMREVVAIAEAFEIIAITSRLPPVPTTSMWERLRILQKGAEDPDSESHAAGRDAQFELWVWATMDVNGVKVELGTPDLRVQTPHGLLHVEAKRLTSSGSFESRVRDAVGTLKRAGGRGLILAGVDQVIRPRGTILSAPSQASMGDRVTELLRGIAREHEAMVARRCEGLAIAGVLYAGRMLGFLSDSPMMGVYHAYHLHDHPNRTGKLDPAVAWLLGAINHPGTRP